MDIGILRLIGPRGVWIAIVGSILPIGIGIGLTVALGYDVKTAVATGCCFGPTSAGIAMNVLGPCGVLRKPIGQLIVAAAIVDDMIALIVLSQLGALTGEVTVAGIVVPIVSALLWFVVGGAIALHVMPKLTDKLLEYWQRGTERVKEKGRISCCLSSNSTADESRVVQALIIMIVLLLALLPATFFTQTSYLLGAFLAGLSNCRNDQLGVYFSIQLKRIVQWLMRLFFAATIGFQVPVSLFGSGTVLLNGLILMVALCGKLAVGPLLTPKLDGTNHWRDCAVVGFSMAGEAEFAFVIAVFGVTNGLMSAELYASTVLAILLSTILSPLLLRTTLALFPYEDEAVVVSKDDVESTSFDSFDVSKARYWHIEIKSQATWGSLPQILQCLLDTHLSILSHKSWHERHPSSPDGSVIWMWNDIYVMDRDETLEASPGDLSIDRAEEIKTYIEKSIQQSGTQTTVTLWIPSSGSESNGSSKEQVFEGILTEMSELTMATSEEDRL